MTIDWQHFTPYSALAGGAIIGGAVALLLLFNGRIAGISGITGGLLSAGGRERAGAPHFWRVADFSPLYAAAAALPPGEVAAGSGWLAIAGLLVGWVPDWAAAAPAGTACAASRGWRRDRSAATAVFMLLGFTTVWLMRHLLGG